MSISILLVPLALALCSTLSSSSIQNMQKNKEKYVKNNSLPILETTYVDVALLNKTLTEHGLTVTKETENYLSCTTRKGALKFFRNVNTEAFKVEIMGIENIHGLISDFELIENEYNSNVQTYTYSKLVNGIKENNMSIESESVLEDNSILITISV